MLQRAKPRNILLITWAFPPLAGVGVQRPWSLAKYLPEHNCNVHVLTAKNAAAVGRDEGLLQALPPNVTVRRLIAPDIPFALRKSLRSLSNSHTSVRSDEPTTGSRVTGVLKNCAALAFSPIKRLLYPDPQVLWAPIATRVASGMIQRHNIDTVIVTVPPFSVFMIGNALKRRFPGLRLISDFRDEWLTYYLSTFSFNDSPHLRQRCAAIEMETVENSDYVVAVTEFTAAIMRRRYSDRIGAKIRVIPNGYDPDLFRSLTNRHHGREKLVLTYIGTVYKPCTPVPLLSALSQLSSEIRSRFEIHFIGHVDEEFRGILAAHADIAHVHGFMPQAAAFKQAETTDYLLLTLTDRGSVPGKIYEYLALNKPILAIVPPGADAARIITETGTGIWAPHDEPQAIRKALMMMVRNSVSYRPNQSMIERYARPSLVASYARLISGEEDTRSAREIVRQVVAC